PLKKKKGTLHLKKGQATSINKLNTGRSSVSTSNPPLVITANTPFVSAASTPTCANASGSSFVYLGGQIPIEASTLPNADLPCDPNMSDLEDDSDIFSNDGIFSGAFDDGDVGAVADFNNIDNTIDVSPIPTLRIHQHHPKDQILVDRAISSAISGTASAGNIPQYPLIRSPAVELSSTSYLEPRVDKYNLLQGGCSDSGISSLRSIGGGMYRDGGSGGSGSDDDGSKGDECAGGGDECAEGGDSEMGGDGDGVVMARSLSTSASGGRDMKVMLKVSPWKAVVRFGKRGKLNPRYVGPFKVLEKVGKVAYKLDLPEEFICRKAYLLEDEQIPSVGVFDERVETEIAAKVTLSCLSSDKLFVRDIATASGNYGRSYRGSRYPL
ncbi:hypothetical protein Tco_1091044, partial [Tanacetum coccineum]